MDVPTRLGPLRVRVAGSGPPALLWHSLFVDSTTWCRVEPALAERRRLVIVDGPNHGANPRVRVPFTLDDGVGVAVDILDHLGVAEPVDWVGNAWGGHVGILFAAEHPDRCRSLAAIGAPVHALSPSDRREIRLLATLYRLFGPRVVVRPLVDALVGAGDAEATAVVADAFTRAGRRGMYDATRWLSLARLDLTPVLPRVVAPTVLTTGTDDPMWTVADARAAVGHLPHGALVVLPGSGHIGPLLRAVPDVVEVLTRLWGDPAGAVARWRHGIDRGPRPDLPAEPAGPEDDPRGAEAAERPAQPGADRPARA
jgi:pimeloyl-ACP methyl ester carboxylesterase